MRGKGWWTFLLMVFVAVGVVSVNAEERKMEREEVRTEDRQELRNSEDSVYGWQLMNEEERRAHRRQMRLLQTEEERERYRLEHHRLMQERARDRGVTLPDEPLPSRRGTGPGGGGGEGGRR